MFFKKKKRSKERRKDLKLRALIDENQKSAEEVRQVAKQLMATIDGDPGWLRRHLLEDQNGRGSDCVSDHTS